MRLSTGRRLKRLIRLVNRLDTLPPGSYALGCDKVTRVYTVAFVPRRGSPGNARASGGIGCPQMELQVGADRIELTQAAFVHQILAFLHLTA